MPEPAPGQKVCRQCKEAKPTTEYHAWRWGKDGLRVYCRKCQNLRTEAARKARVAKERTSRELRALETAEAIQQRQVPTTLRAVAPGPVWQPGTRIDFDTALQQFFLENRPLPEFPANLRPLLDQMMQGIRRGEIALINKAVDTLSRAGDKPRKDDDGLATLIAILGQGRPPAGGAGAPSDLGAAPGDHAGAGLDVDGRGAGSVSAGGGV